MPALCVVVLDIFADGHNSPRWSLAKAVLEMPGYQ
jgi:hypothetical protein